MGITFFSSIINHSAPSAYEASAIVGLLPPWEQEKVEKQTLREHPELTNKLGNQVIWEIRKNDHGYLVVTHLCEMQVDVKYLPREPKICGPARFELVFHEPVWFNT